MEDLTNELKAKLLAAKSAGETAELLREAGADEAQAERLWDEISARRNDRELSPDELDAVSGGADRNWATEGCAATVEYGSWCGSDDRCVYFQVTYDYEPTSHLCPSCGRHMYLQGKYKRHDEYEEQYRCKFCGRVVIEITPIKREVRV